jgi:uncharacterized protein DUF3631
VIEAFDYTPYLHVTSPEKRCGKSRLLDCIELLVAIVWRVISPSQAVLFRKIEADRPTLLLDEVDTIFCRGKDEGKESLRALLNAGFDRHAKVPRCIPPHNDIKEFGVFCPKALAGIGKLPDTVNDRCIPIQLARRSKEEAIERFRRREAEPAAGPIREALAQWSQAQNTITKLQAARPEIPETLGNRQADICEPLLAIADMAGGKWPEQARAALNELCAGEIEDSDSIGVALLYDIREIFDSTIADRLPTKQLLEALIAKEDGPWAERWEHDLLKDTRGPAAKLARLLKPHGIKARVIRLADDSTPRGYRREDFQDAWKRYCPLKAPAECNDATF